ncbi:MAG: (2Fe-2S)-binding protein [Oligoflexia bacterium]|nr:(2Fe-2S)-binding protein [Oligoflexia bacterium]
MPTVSLMELNDAGQITGKTEAEFEGKEHATLYDCADDAGQELPHGCLAGSCGSCRILVIEGEENLSSPSAIERDTISHISDPYIEKFGEEFFSDKSIRLSCRAKIKGEGDVKFANLK